MLLHADSKDSDKTGQISILTNILGLAAKLYTDHSFRPTVLECLICFTHYIPNCTRYIHTCSKYTRVVITIP